VCQSQALLVFHSQTLHAVLKVTHVAIMSQCPENCICAAGPLQYNPVSGSPGLPPSQSRYTPSQSPERPFNPLDPLAFLVNQPATQSQGQGHQRSNASAVSSGRRGRAYQPPSDGASTMVRYMPSQHKELLSYACSCC